MKGDLCVIHSLKRQAAKYYNQYYDELDRYDCGATLAEEINPRMLKAKIEFNKTFDELAKIDPSTPSHRL